MKRPGQLAIALAVVVSIDSLPAFADDLAEGRKLYEATLYERALVVLAALESPEALEYRALCLLALGRTDDAGDTIESLIAAAPGFAPSTDDRPPRFVKLFASTRQRFLPTMVRTLFADARQQFQKKSYPEAADGFTKILSLKNDPDLKAYPELEELLYLTAAYVDVLSAAKAPAAAEPIATAPPAPAATEPPPAPARPAPTMTQPAVINEPLPAVPRSMARLNRTFKGAMRLVIGVDGRVKSAVMTAPVHPEYDWLLLSASKSWRYAPATLNGMPAEAERTVDVVVNTSSR